MSYPDRIISLLGGTRPASRKLERPASTIQSWRTAGVIPAQHHADVIERARRHGVVLTPADFFDLPAPADPACHGWTRMERYGDGEHEKGPRNVAG